MNNSTLGFYPRIQKLQPLYGTALFMSGIKELRGRSFDFWAGYGWFQKKKSCRLISREKILARKYLAKKNPTLKKNLSWRIMLEKILHRCISGKNSISKGQKGQKILTQTKSLIPPPPLQKSNGRPLNEPLTLRQSTICKIDASIYDAELMALMYDYVTRARISPPSFVRKHNSSHLHSLCVGILAFHLYCLWNSFMQNFATLYFQNEAWRWNLLLWGEHA